MQLHRHANKTLCLDDRHILWLEYNSEQTFLAAGHMAILVDINPAGMKEFLARVSNVCRGKDPRQIHEFYTTVTDGSNAVTYRDEMGYLRRSDVFEVLVLRYDLEDILPYCDPVPEDAFNVTGPLYWTKGDDASDCVECCAKARGEYEYYGCPSSCLYSTINPTDSTKNILQSADFWCHRCRSKNPFRL